MRAGFSRRATFSALFVVALVAMLSALSSVALAAPANDDFAAAEVVFAGTPVWAEKPLHPTNVGATKQAGEPEHGGDPGGHSVWFSWTAEGTYPVNILACGELPILLGVYTGATVGGLTELGGIQGCGRVRIAATAGTEYKIAVDGKGGAEGDFNLIIERPLANDAFAQPDTLGPGAGFNARGTNQLTSKEPGEPDHAGDPGGHSLWYRWTPTESGMARVYTCSNTPLDTLLGIYTGTAVSELTTVAANDDTATPEKCIDSEVRFAVTKGTTYRVAVDGKGGTEGEFELKGKLVPAEEEAPGEEEGSGEGEGGEGGGFAPAAAWIPPPPLALAAPATTSAAKPEPKRLVCRTGFRKKRNRTTGRVRCVRTRANRL